MEDKEIFERAGRIEDAFLSESGRTTGPMAQFLLCCHGIAWHVSMGEYHREALFKRAVYALSVLGFDTSGADTGTRPRSASVRAAAENAMRDTWEFWEIAGKSASRGHRAFDVVSRADDLMECIDGDFGSLSPDDAARMLHDAVTKWLENGGKGDGEPLGSCYDLYMRELLAYDETARPVTGECVRLDASGITLGNFQLDMLPHGRELPERVMFNPPATIAFWKDGTKTVAKCSKGDEFSEYVGLLVCIAKRNLKVPRRGTFEDAMARLLKRAERPGGGADRGATVRDSR